MEAKIEQDGAAVVLTFDNGYLVTGRLIVGRVGEDQGRNGWRQVCEGLHRLGKTLNCSGEDLIDVMNFATRPTAPRERYRLPRNHRSVAPRFSGSWVRACAVQNLPLSIFV